MTCDAQDRVVAVEARVSRADNIIAALLYMTGETMAKARNGFLGQQQQQQVPYGPFLHVADAAVLLKQLRRRKSSKAAALQGVLDAFAAANGFDAEAFEQWDEVVYAKDRRDGFGHPIRLRPEDLTYLQGLLSDPSSGMQYYKHAVQALTVFARKVNAPQC